MEKSVPEHLPDDFFLIPVSVYIQSGLQEKNRNSNHSVPPFLLGGIELLPNFQKRGDLTGPQFLEEGCWERGGDFFRGCAIFR